VAAVDGLPVDGIDPEALALHVCSDSREVREGSLFIALSGEHVDGHDFAEEAASRGAVAVLGARPTGVPTIVVVDPLVALGRLAQFHLGRLSKTTVIAITGSVGKTTAKDLTAAVLESVDETVAPPGSFNNELGLPLTVLSARESTRYLVLEMGARGRGHIQHLCEIAPPDIGVELNVGSAHVGEFGDQDAVASAKAELVEALGDGGHAVLNADDEQVRAMAVRTAAPVVWFGMAATAQIRAESVRLDAQGRPHFLLSTPTGEAPVSLQLVGEHAVPNALAAATVGHLAGLAPAAIAASLSSAAPRSRWRMEISERSDGLVVINDAYNASPESMRAALKSLKQIAGGRRAWAVLGEMRELGETSAAQHDAIGRLAVRLDVQRLVVVGEGARQLHLAAGLEGSWGRESMFVPDVESATALLRDELLPGDVVLVKASRAVGLERVAAAILEEPLVS
jgi:UDP-N-acetylmuramoyl-tripeptide--D-alanyl-D-alanine ligase